MRKKKKVANQKKNYKKKCEPKINQWAKGKASPPAQTHAENKKISPLPLLRSFLFFFRCFAVAYLYCDATEVSLEYISSPLQMEVGVKICTTTCIVYLLSFNFWVRRPGNTKAVTHTPTNNKNEKHDISSCGH